MELTLIPKFFVSGKVRRPTLLCYCSQFTFVKTQNGHLRLPHKLDKANQHVLSHILCIKLLECGGI
jgi:hypothetical protein